MRRTFAALLAKAMESDETIHLVTADMGYGMFDHIAKTYPERFWNVGAAEQAMVGMAVGIALAGKRPFCYSITPFLLWRPAELIRNYLHGEKIPVTLVGSGRDDDYDHDGPTHAAHDAHALLDVLPNIWQYFPTSVDDLRDNFTDILAGHHPSFLSLRR